MVIWNKPRTASRLSFRIPDAPYQRYGKSWDARDMSRQIELNIGKDLQFIRVNGTLVGGCIGLILYLLSQLPALFPLGNF